MPELFPQFNDKSSSPPDSWFQRVHENLRHLFDSQAYLPAVTAGSPVKFVIIEASTRGGSSKGFSAIAHAAILCAAFLLLTKTPLGPGGLRPIPLPPQHGPLSFIPPLNPESFGHPSRGRKGGSGDEDTRPARWGNLAPYSSVPLAPPRLPSKDNIEMPVPPAVFDQNAPENVPVVTFLGIPWSKENNDSAGQGKRHGVGNGDGNGMGDGDGDGVGAEEDGSVYANVASQVACLYCPEPPYTEEARKAKLQGTVLLQVLVGTDGLAKRIRVQKGLGMGMDEQAVEKVRGWRFKPARDAARRPIAVWVTIETHFLLF